MFLLRNDVYLANIFGCGSFYCYLLASSASPQGTCLKAIVTKF